MNTITTGLIHSKPTYIDHTHIASVRTIVSRVKQLENKIKQRNISAATTISAVNVITESYLIESVITAMGK